MVDDEQGKAASGVPLRSPAMEARPLTEAAGDPPPLRAHTPAVGFSLPAVVALSQFARSRRDARDRAAAETGWGR